MKKSEIELTQHAYILEEMAVQLKELAKEPLQEEFQVEIMTIDFLFENEEDFSYENLQEVIVYVGEEENKDREGVVNEVDEVVIGPEDKETEKDEIDKEEIISHLEEIWQLYDKKIVIEWEGEMLFRKLKDFLSSRKGDEQKKPLKGYIIIIGLIGLLLLIVGNIFTPEKENDLEVEQYSHETTQESNQNNHDPSSTTTDYKTLEKKL